MIITQLQMGIPTDVSSRCFKPIGFPERHVAGAQKKMNDFVLKKWTISKWKFRHLPTINFQVLCQLISSHKSQVNPINHRRNHLRNPVNQFSGREGLQGSASSWLWLATSCFGVISVSDNCFFCLSTALSCFFLPHSVFLEKENKR